MKFLATTTLSVKLSLLLCVIYMGGLNLTGEAFAQLPPPCHQEVAQTEDTEAQCDMCKTALEAWEENAVATSKITLAEVTERALGADSVVENFALELKPLEGVYQTYYPPPQVLWKSVTPNTKTIVLVV